MDLTETQLKHFKSLLQQKMRELDVIMESTSESARVVELDQSSVGRLSRMDAMQSQAMSQELQRRQLLELKLIAAALKRIDDEEYGHCVSCDEQIMTGRLELNPAVTLCVECAGEMEKQ